MLNLHHRMPSSLLKRILIFQLRDVTYEESRLKLSQTSFDSVVHFSSFESCGPTLKRSRAENLPPIPANYNDLPAELPLYYTSVMVIERFCWINLPYRHFCTYTLSIMNQTIILQCVFLFSCRPILRFVQYEIAVTYYWPIRKLMSCCYYKLMKWLSFLD